MLEREMVETEVNGAGTLADRYDVVVVGGGAAGLSGALVLARARRSVLVVDAGAPRNAPAAGVHNYLGQEGTPPLELLETGRREVAGYGGRVVAGEVTGARAEDRGFVVDLADGRQVRARRLLVTTGVVDELPAVAGVTERWGHDVLHCPYCHGWEVRDRRVAVLGGPVGVHTALLWRQWSEHVTLLLNGSDPDEQERVRLAARGVEVVAGDVEALEVQDDALRGVRLGDGTTVPCDALVVATRLTVRSAMLAGLGLVPTEVRMGDVVVGERIEADPTGATSVPGVWVAGNLAQPMAQVVAAAASGTMAGAAINGDLVAEDTDQAVSAT